MLIFKNEKAYETALKDYEKKVKIEKDILEEGASLLQCDVKDLPADFITAPVQKVYQILEGKYGKDIKLPLKGFKLAELLGISVSRLKSLTDDYKQYSEIEKPKEKDFEVHTNSPEAEERMKWFNRLKEVLKEAPMPTYKADIARGFGGHVIRLDRSKNELEIDTNFINQRIPRHSRK